MPALLANGESGGKKPHGTDQSEVSSPIIAIMNSFWSIAPISARRTAGLSNGGYRWFGRSM